VTVMALRSRLKRSRSKAEAATTRARRIDHLSVAVVICIGGPLIGYGAGLLVAWFWIG
jgi:hypothetical protein